MTTPEEKLWLSVIGLAVIDAEGFAKRARKAIERVGGIPTSLWDDILQIDREIRSSWFNEICGFVDIHPDRIKSLISNIKEEFKINNPPLISNEEYLRRIKDLKVS